MKKNERGLDIDKTKPNLISNKDDKESKAVDTNLNRNIGGSENKSDNREEDRKKTIQSNKLPKAPSSSQKKEPSSPKLEKISEDNQRKGAINHMQDKKNENTHINNLVPTMSLRKFQLDISQMIEKPQDKLFPKK